MLLNMIIEQTKAYQKRMVYNPETRTFSERDCDSLQYTRGFPYPYGWIKESGTPPQPHFDVILMSDGEFELGDELEVTIIGMFKRNDGDNKYVAVENNREIYDLSKLSVAETDALHRLYPRVSEGEGWNGRAQAEIALKTTNKAL